MEAHTQQQFNILHIMLVASKHLFYVHGSFCVIVHVDKLYRMHYLTAEVESGQLAIARSSRHF